MNCVTPTFWYAYDALGRIVSLAHDLGGVSFDRAYSYDAMDRLAADGGTAYSYDAAGNRMTRTEDGETVTYALGQGDRLASWTGGSYQYDEAGCVTRISRGADTWDLAWNGQYQLVEVSTNGAFAEAYAYDALGRRVTTRNAEGTERHVYDDNWQVVADLDEDGKVIRSYVWGEGIDRLLAVKIGSRTYTALTDVQGTVWGYADEGGNVVAKWTYDAWGDVLSEEIAEGATELRVVRYRFQGRERSASTGLANFRMRWYDAITGRWLSKDPIGLSGGLNLYAFCAGDPLGCCDPGGLIAIPLPILLPALQIGVVIGLAYYGSEVATELILYFSKKLIDTATISLPKGGHTKNMRPSNREKHQKGDTRRQNDQRRSRRLNGGKSFPFPLDFSNDDDDCR